MTIAAGRLRRNRITIQQRAPGQDGMGGPTNDWSSNYVASNVPAEILQTAGGETIRRRQVAAHVTHVVMIRYRSGLSPTMRLFDDTSTDQPLYIDAIYDRNGFKQELEIHCRLEST